MKYTQKELYETILAIADGSMGYGELLKWVLEHQVQSRKSQIKSARVFYLFMVTGIVGFEINHTAQEIEKLTE